MAVSKDNANLVDDLKRTLLENPDFLKEAIKSLGMDKQPVGDIAYEIIGTEMRTVPICKMEATRIVRTGDKEVKHYLVKNLRGDILSIPEHCIDDYGINVEVGRKIVDKDGISPSEKSRILNYGAY